MPSILRNVTASSAQHWVRRPVTPPAPSGVQSASPMLELQRIAIHQRGRWRIIPYDQIEWLEARGGATVLHTSEGEVKYGVPLQACLEKLDPRIFRRIHRRTAVRLSTIASVTIDPSGRYQLHLSSDHTLVVGRRFRHVAQELVR